MNHKPSFIQPVPAQSFALRHDPLAPGYTPARNGDRGSLRVRYPALAAVDAVTLASQHEPRPYCGLSLSYGPTMFPYTMVPPDAD